MSPSHGIHQRLSRLQRQWGRHMRISTSPIIRRPHSSTTQKIMGTRTDSSYNVHSGNELQLELENFQLRAYQYEMLQKTMRGNTILAMDTGSGKTFIAISRIIAELEVCPSEKFAWFLAPTVTLAEQQHHVLSQHLPAYQTRLLIGDDDVVRWGKKSIWDEVLFNTRIVASTHQVLLDALIHGFVRISKIAILVFDEVRDIAHHCSRNHPASRIMQDFYHPCRKRSPDQVPAILGLTASPVVNPKIGGLEMIEQILNATAITPKIFREQMLQFVPRPIIIQLKYPPNPPNLREPQSLHTLEKLHENLDITQDPYVIKLKASPGNDAAIRKVLASRQTYCQDHIKQLLNKAKTIHAELGPWPTRYFIDRCIEKLEAEATEESRDFGDLDNNEISYLRRHLATVTSSKQQDIKEDREISPKAMSLINYLQGKAGPNFSGLVFVETRATVALLAHVLSQHPRTKHVLKVGTFVGASSHASRHKIGELLDVRKQKTALEDLRSGQKNLIIATSALEEGIDVSACNHVVCFQRPKSLKSFIQRRGRARHSESTYAIMYNELDDSQDLSTWHDVEEQMKQIYMDETRPLREAQELEIIDERKTREFQVDSTGAKITLNDAVGHLYHFCATLSRTQYVDARPIFTFSETKGAITAHVLLPSSVDSSVREAASKYLWKSERGAKRDAAFEAYISLYHAGLLNDHLLPPKFDLEADEAKLPVGKQPSLVEVSAQLDAWSDIVARKWQGQPMLFASSVLVRCGEMTLSEMVMILPLAMPHTINFRTYWDATKSFEVEISPGRPLDPLIDRKAMYANCTALILNSIYTHRMESDSTDFPCLFVPTIAEDLQTWMAAVCGSNTAQVLLGSDPDPSHVGLIRDLARNGLAHFFHGIETVPRISLDEPFTHADPKMRAEDDSEDEVFIKVMKIPKRSDFLHEIANIEMPKDRVEKYQRLPVDKCNVDRLPFEFSRFAMLIPSIMHEVELFLAADFCRSSLLPSVKINDLSLIVTATAASVAREQTNYQRMEFLGDSMLKYYTSLTLMAEHLTWHEGFLSAKKDHIVSNSRLALSALQLGLEQFIRTTPFTGLKWRPIYISKLIADRVKDTRDMSTKTLADVVEALIGAAYVDGGANKVLSCLAVFYPEVPWAQSSLQIEKLKATYAVNVQYPPPFSQLEDLINYTFDKKSVLVEALTHPSHHGSKNCASYQRLEFLGDAILDNIIVTNAYRYKPLIPTPSLHLIRTALVNGSFLAFLCLKHRVPVTRYDAVEDHYKGFSTIKTTTYEQIWCFMRSAEPRIRQAQQSCVSRYDSLQDEILHALIHGKRYPWALLTKLDAPKFFSDLIESIVGAIYIDSHGSFSACQSFLENLGLMDQLRRAMDGEFALLHPKEELGQLANQEKVNYVTVFEDEEDEEDGMKKVLTCVVSMGEREIAKIRGGANVIDVETRVAEEAVRIIKEERATLTRNVSQRNVMEAPGVINPSYESYTAISESASEEEWYSASEAHSS